MFEALNKVSEELTSHGVGGQMTNKEQGKEGEISKEFPQEIEEEMTQVDEGQGEETEDMDIWELYLYGIEQACANPKSGYIPFQQVAPLREAIIKSKSSKTLGVVSESLKFSKGKIRVRRSNAQRIQEVGGKLVALDQYPNY